MVLRNGKYVLAAVAGFLLLVAFGLPSSISRRGKGAVRTVVTPAQRGVSGFGRRLREAAAAIRGIGGMVEQNHELSRELVRVQAELDTLREYETQNERLRAALKFYTVRSQKRSMIPSEVISRDISGWWYSVRINRGKNHGVGRNMAVVSPDGLVGKTHEVSGSHAEVLLVCDPACRVPARIGRVNVFGLVSGRGANLKGQPVARMRFINKDAEIRVGDEVVTSGLSGADGVFPEGVHIGYVESVHKDDMGLYQYADIAPRAVTSLMEYVFVVSMDGGEAVR